ncbi:MAG: FtsQ-type POTRA domain-containing protein [Flavobacteriales bacterium]|nr:FtsQ-type POTRA domain-containing protein [Flavobacteriales bacterium]MCX7768355.1 FtsQ-type POTRA domain-containing protein [Flavobacteriales bacterium]MDW8409085.1 FtsQ-type POTRA domain-containing protein [Flavobacteriales bacterium]
MKKNPLLKILKIPAFLVFLAGVGFMVYYGHSYRAQAECRQIDIRYKALPQLTSRAEIYNIIRKECDTLEGFLQINLAGLEARLDSLPFIKKSEVYRTLNGTLIVNLEERTPVARVFTPSGASYFVDEQLQVIPVRAGHTPMTALVTGKVPESEEDAKKTFHDPWLKNLSALDDAVGMLYYIRQDTFWHAMIEQVHITEENELELVPRVGNHIVLLGDTVGLAGKLNKLHLFYTEALSRGGWKSFRYINLKFKNQIICKTT